MTTQPTPESKTLEAIFASNPVGQALRPLLKPFDHLGLDPEIYKAIAEVLMLSYQLGLKDAQEIVKKAAGQ